MNKVKNILWGAVLVIVGLLLVLDVLNVITFDLFFKGWWTLIIIVPCAIGLITDREKTGNLIGVLIGVALLLASRDIIPFELLWKLALPVAVVIIGAVIIFKAIGKKDAREVEKKVKENSEPLQEYCATFSGVDADLSGETFTGASLTAVFGGVKLDLREALINSDAVIKVSAIFGGVDIFVPDDVNVKISSSSIFGGVEDKKKAKKKDGAHTLYISASCVFGGCDIK